MKSPHSSIKNLDSFRPYMYQTRVRAELHLDPYSYPTLRSIFIRDLFARCLNYHTDRNNITRGTWLHLVWWDVSGVH